METMKNIMEVEKQLLTINDSDKKYTLSMNDLYKLKTYIDKVGEITNLYFETQVDYLNLIKNKDNFEELMKEYNGKLYNSLVDIDLREIENFIKTHK